MCWVRFAKTNLMYKNYDDLKNQNGNEKLNVNIFNVIRGTKLFKIYMFDNIGKFFSLI
jgi:hypothetical protein